MHADKTHPIKDNFKIFEIKEKQYMFLLPPHSPFEIWPHCAVQLAFNTIPLLQPLETEIIGVHRQAWLATGKQNLDKNDWSSLAGIAKHGNDSDVTCR